MATNSTTMTVRQPASSQAFLLRRTAITANQPVAAIASRQTASPIASVLASAKIRLAIASNDRRWVRPNGLRRASVAAPKISRNGSETTVN